MSARARGGLLDPLVEQQLALQRQLAAFARAIAFGQATVWGLRGLCLGLAVDTLGLLARWLALPFAPPAPSLLLIAAPPVLLALGGALLAVSRPRPARWVARRVDAELGLAERALTATAPGWVGPQTNPLALYQLRDAVAHLERADPIRTFRPRVPQREALSALGLALAVALFAVAPSPFSDGGGPLDPRGRLVREQAERLDRVAQALGQDAALQSRELDQVRELLRQAAQMLEQQASNPERAAAGLDDIERQLQAMADGDDELAMALAAVASALASTAETRDLSLALQTGDLREVSRAARDLARQTQGMSTSARARAGQALRTAATRMGDDARGLAEQLRQAADGLDRQRAGEQAQQLSERDALAQAQAALRDLAETSAEAAARQRALAALQGARSSLEDGQGQQQSGPGDTFGRETSDRGGRGEQPGAGQAGGGDSPPGEGTQSGTGFGGGEPDWQGIGGQPDVMTRPEMLRSGQAIDPDEIGDAPVLQAAGANPSGLDDAAVRPDFSAQPAVDPSLDASIPLGLRELVKQYFTTQEGNP